MKTKFSNFLIEKCRMINNKIAVLLAVIFVSANAFADNEGSITGLVKDANGTLPGASIQLKGTSHGTISNLDGTYRLNNVPEGEQTLILSFIGYNTTEITIDVQPGKSTSAGATDMTEFALEIGEVSVKASYKPSQQRALNIQKLSPRIMNVIASDAIGKLPDRNAAEAVQRIPGVSIERDHGEGRYVVVRGTPTKWNSNLINGDRLPSTDGTSNDTGGDRAVPLDIFPTEMIQYVELSKAITPDMEGDAIGGSVNFITRTAPIDRTLNVTMAGGYNDQAQAGSYNASLLYGDRVFNDKLGFMVAGTIWERNWGTDNYEVTYNETEQDAVNQYSIADLDLRDYLGKRTTKALNYGMEYNINNDHKIYSRGMYSLFTDDEMARQHIYNFNEGETQMLTRRGVMNINLYGGEFGGEHALGSKVDFDWKYSTYTNRMDMGDLPAEEVDGETGYMMATFTQSGIQFDNLSEDGYKFLEGDAPAGVHGDAPDNIQPYQSASTPFVAQANILENMMLINTQSEERDNVGQMNLKMDVNHKLNLKAGVKYRQKHKKSGLTYNVYIPGAYLQMAYGMTPTYAIPTLDQMETESFPTNGGFLQELGGNYDNILHDQITMNQLEALYGDEANENYGFYKMSMGKDNPTTAAAFYSGSENVMAGYLMGDYKINDQLQVIGGVRYESTAVTYKGNTVTVNEDESTTLEPIESKNTTGALLPMVHVKYSPNSKTNFRVAYTKTFARPNFSSLSPGSVINEQERMISVGNPDLDYTFSNNYDLLGEYFFDNVGVLSGGVFYKQITNDIYNRTSLLNRDGVLYEVVRPENLESAWLMGAEVGISKRFDFLPGFLSGFGFEGNYTYTKSVAKVPTFTTNDNDEVVETITEQSLPSQADHIFNASLFYEKGGLLLRAAANYKGDYIVSFSDNGSDHNRWYGENLTVDFSAAYAITKNLRVFAEVNNLTNAPLRYYHGVSERPEQVEFYSIRGQLGLRLSIF